MPIDVHAHFYPTRYTDFLRRRGGESGRLAEHTVSQRQRSRYMSGAIEERVEFLSSVRIRQVLCIPNQSILVSDVKDSSANAAAANDALAELCVRYPDRFTLFATLPLVDGDASVRELERSVREHGAVGAVFPTHVFGRRLDWEGLEPVYATLEQMGLPMFLHPLPPPHQVAPEGHQDCGLTGTLYFPQEDAHALLRMVGGGVFDRHPGLRVICPHLGGPISLLFFRITHGLRADLPGGGDLPHPVSDYLKRVLFDTVSMHAPAVRCACETFGPGNIVFGTDFPYEQEPEVKINLAIIEALDLTADERQGILEDNIMRWLPRDSWRSV